jgi:TolB-like protein
MALEIARVGAFEFESGSDTVLADVFISYKHEDRARVQPLVDALQSKGLEVWWDVGIGGGARWRQTIAENLSGARCVIVMWSEISVGPEGEFVQDEASHAKDRGVYLPVTLDPVAPPLGFGQIQCVPLHDWNGDSDHPQFNAMFDVVQAVLRGERQRRPRAAAAPKRRSRPSLAVLEFRHAAGDEEQGYFAEAVAEDIIAGLAKSHLIEVISRQSSLTYDAEDVDTKTICNDLGVRYLLRGQVRRMGRAIRVAADLIDGEADDTVWSGRFDRPIDDLFAVQDEIVTAIVSALEPALLGREQTQSFQRTRDLAHWDLFMRGRYHFWRPSVSDGHQAQEWLTKALELAPDDVPTLSMLALAKLNDIWAGVAKDPATLIAEAHAMAMRAVSLDGADSSAHQALGVVLSMLGQSEQAMAEERRALELNPYDVAAAGELGRLLAFAGRTDEALRMSERAIKASPNNTHAFLWFRSKAIACFIAGRHADAAGFAADACARRPDYFFLHFLRAACHFANGDAAQARAAYIEGVELMPRYTMRGMKMGHPFTNPEDLERFATALRGAGWDG